METQETVASGEALFCDTLVMLVRSDWPDLTSRQLAVLMICYLEEEAQTVRGLAEKLNISKPAITRALDRLEEFDLGRRKPDPLDRRSIFFTRTARGKEIIGEIRARANGEPARPAAKKKAKLAA